MTKFCSCMWSAVLAVAIPQFSRGAESTIVFGLTNVALGNAVLVENAVSNLGEDGGDGVSILLGEADAGVFAYPDANHDPQGGEYMIGKAYGKLNGVVDQFICSMRGHTVMQESGFGVYPLTLDFSALGVTNFLAQVFNKGGGFVAQREIGLRSPVLRTDYNGYKIERANPFWRTPQGGIAAVVDFEWSTGFELPAGDETEGPIVFGTRLILHALNPTGAVQFISRVDVTTGTGVGSTEGAGLTEFVMNEVRPAVFGRPHKAIGDILLEPRLGSLSIRRRDPGVPEPPNDFTEGTGVHIELLARASEASVNFQPVALSGAGNEFGFTAMGKRVGFYITRSPLQIVGTLRLYRGMDAFVLNAYLPNLGTNTSQVRMAVFRAGAQVGITETVETENFPGITVSGEPRVLRGMARANTLESVPSVGLTLDGDVNFTVTLPSGTVTLTGDEVRFLLVGPIYSDMNPYQTWLGSIDAMLANSRGLDEFTIIGENEVPLPAPELSIARAGSQLILSWPDPNRAYHPFSTTNLAKPFNEWSPYVDHSAPIATLSIGTTNAARFYRLLHFEAFYD